MDEFNYSNLIVLAYSNSLQALALSKALEEFIVNETKRKQFQASYKKHLAELAEKQTIDLNLPHDEAFLQVLAKCKSQD